MMRCNIARCNRNFESLLVSDFTLILRDPMETLRGKMVY